MIPQTPAKLILALLLVSVAVNLLSFQHGHNWGDDFAGYLNQAQTISKGSYADLKAHMARMNTILNYPWGYPILLFPVIGFMGAHLILLKMFTYLFFLLSLVFIYLLLQRDKVFALLTLLLLSTSPYFWEFKENLLADYPNLCFVFLSLVLIDRIVLRRQVVINAVCSNLVVGLSIFLAFMMRNQSIVLLPTLLIAQIGTRKGNRIGVAAMPYITFLVFVLLFAWMIPVRSTSYANQYRFDLLFVLRTIGHNLVYYGKVWNELFQSMSVIAHFSRSFTLLVICLAGVGMIISFKKEYRLIIIFFWANLCLFLVTPFYQGLRYAMPIVPLFIFFFVKGSYYLLKKASPKYGRPLYACVLSLLLLFSFKSIIATAYDNYKTSRIMKGPYEQDSRELFAWISEHTRPEQSIDFWKPRVVLLYTGRNSIFTADWYAFHRKQPDYLVYYKYPDVFNDQIPLDSLYQHKEELSPCFANASFIMFKTKKPGN